MKYPVKLAVLFGVSCVAGTLLTAIFVMLNYDLTVLVAGSDVTFFSADFFIRALCVVFPLVCALSLLLVVMYAIRHPAKKLPLFATYGALWLVVWAALLPLVTAFSIGYADNPLDAPVAEDLTPGYFREFEGNIYFYSRTFRYSPLSRDVYGEGLLIDMAGARGKMGEVYPFSSAVTVKPRNAFADVIFFHAAKMPPVVEMPVYAYLVLCKAAQSSLLAGVIPWIAFCFLGLALFSVVFLRNINSWRFLNASVVAAAAILVAGVNALLYSHRFFSDVSLACADFFFDLGYYLPDVFSGVARIREPLALFVNIAFVALFALVGCICRLLKNRRGSVAVYAEEDDE